mmetsp:Transcript_15943/g.39974  ORF Transcript_15943/g.39974 Transcript_15943/m.39974 type:complete len:387 (-) Transcript_15943:353-1513(-)
MWLSLDALDNCESVEKKQCRDEYERNELSAPYKPESSIQLLVDRRNQNPRTSACGRLHRSCRSSSPPSHTLLHSSCSGRLLRLAPYPPTMRGRRHVCAQSTSGHLGRTVERGPLGRLRWWTGAVAYQVGREGGEVTTVGDVHSRGRVASTLGPVRGGERGEGTALRLPLPHWRGVLVDLAISHLLEVVAKPVELLQHLDGRAGLVARARRARELQLDGRHRPRRQQVGRRLQDLRLVPFHVSLEHAHVLLHEIVDAHGRRLVLVRTSPPVRLEDTCGAVHPRHPQLLQPNLGRDGHAQRVHARHVVHHVAVDGGARGEARVEREAEAHHLLVRGDRLEDDDLAPQRERVERVPPEVAPHVDHEPVRPVAAPVRRGEPRVSECGLED